METEEIRSMLEIIDQQVSSSILGGMEEKYEELERLGYIKINRDSVQHSAALTEFGHDYLEKDWD
ncbi:hypothetical protein [Pedobacter metabolipauper]|uniref:Uncharacterized protein n=1 Tax=Pedobacter metabolipauper TaxID=425513 RepID=A0A4R6SU49_9SPHI|nr:hypothetical protein [Pedobacter metabolipauper]TDQ07166.1 hypothetical protein ATK78_4183 [Pedobacter metabolipauper]